MTNSFKKVCRWLHLWLGLVSGIIVFIVCITGALYVFKDEIEDTTQPWRFVEPQIRPQMLPGPLIAIADKAAGERRPQAITYGEDGDAVRVDYWNTEGDTKAVFLNPYTGYVIKVVEHKAGDFNFFDFVLQGHRTLWLPRAVGSVVVDYGVLVFFVVLVTGLVLWWPKRWNRKSVRSRFTIHRPLRVRRFTFDLHNVIGFYALLPLIVLCFTGLLFGLSWFNKAVYSAVSGGRELQDYAMPLSDTLKVDTTKTASLDTLCLRVCDEEPEAAGYYFTIPQTATDIYRVSVVHERGSYYRTDNLFYDQYTLKPLQGIGPWAGKYDRVSAADSMMRMNLEIHDGRILGIFGKIIMFFAALVGASLPVTGGMLYLRRKKAN